MTGAYAQARAAARVTVGDGGTAAAAAISAAPLAAVGVTDLYQTSGWGGAGGGDGAGSAPTLTPDVAAAAAHYHHFISNGVGGVRDGVGGGGGAGSGGGCGSPLDAVPYSSSPEGHRFAAAASMLSFLDGLPGRMAVAPSHHAAALPTATAVTVEGLSVGGTTDDGTGGGAFGGYDCSPVSMRAEVGVGSGATVEGGGVALGGGAGAGGSGSGSGGGGGNGGGGGGGRSGGGGSGGGSGGDDALFGDGDLTTATHELEALFDDAPSDLDDGRSGVGGSGGDDGMYGVDSPGLAVAMDLAVATGVAPGVPSPPLLCLTPSMAAAPPPPPPSLPLTTMPPRRSRPSAAVPSVASVAPAVTAPVDGDDAGASQVVAPLPPPRKRPPPLRGAGARTSPSKRRHRPAAPTLSCTLKLEPEQGDKDALLAAGAASEGAADGSMATTRGASPSPLTPGGGSNGGGAVVEKAAHNSHTRRCRAKVNAKFEELRSVLPPPPASVELKFKAQVLDWTITCYRSVTARKAWLEAEVATSSPTATAAWVRRTVQQSASVAEVLTAFLRLVCTRRRWQYAEVWYPVWEIAGAQRGVVRPPAAPAVPVAAAATAVTTAGPGAAMPAASSPLTSSSNSLTHPLPPPPALDTTTTTAAAAAAAGTVGVGVPPLPPTAPLLPPTAAGARPLLRYGQSTVAEVDMAVPDSHRPVPADVASRLAAFRDASRTITWAPGEGLPGRVAASLRPVWVGSPPPSQPPPPPPPPPRHGSPAGGSARGAPRGGSHAGGWAGRAGAAAAAGLAAAMGVPIMAGGRVVAVAVFFATTPRAYDADAVAAVHTIAGVLGNELTDAGLPP
ncbi:hypothetical protein MMPV_009117 [Pyropia vietnamensis]